MDNRLKIFSEFLKKVKPRDIIYVKPNKEEVLQDDLLKNNETSPSGEIELVPQNLVGGDASILIDPAVEREIIKFNLGEEVRQKIIQAMFELRSELELERLEGLSKIIPGSNKDIQFKKKEKKIISAILEEAKRETLPVVLNTDTTEQKPLGQEDSVNWEELKVQAKGSSNEYLDTSTPYSDKFDLKSVIQKIKEATLKLEIELKIDKFTSYENTQKDEEFMVKLTPEEWMRLQTEKNVLALQIFLDARKDHKKRLIESRGILRNYYDKAVKYYEGLEETAEGRIKKKFLDAAFSGAVFLSPAVGFGMLSSSTAVARWAVRIGVITGFQVAAVKFVDRINKSDPNRAVNAVSKFSSKVFNIFHKKSETRTKVPEFHPEDVTNTPVPQFKPENTIDTLDPKGVSFNTEEQNVTLPDVPELELDLKRVKYAAMALGTGAVFMLSGSLVGGVTLARLVTKEFISELLKRKKEKYKIKLEELDASMDFLDFSQDPDMFLQALQNIQVERERIVKKINLIKRWDRVVDNALTFANGFVGGVYGDIAGASVRRVAMAPEFEFRKRENITRKKKEKVKKKLEKKDNFSKISQSGVQ